MRVKCRRDGELPVGRKAAVDSDTASCNRRRIVIRSLKECCLRCTFRIPLLHIRKRIAAAFFWRTVREYLLMSSFTGCCKGGIFL